MNLHELLLDVEQYVDIQAPPDAVFPMLLRRLGEASTTPDNQPMPLVLEPHAGGRWYRDRGNGIQHLWGFVQVIKPPVLLEISGPMFMSYPAINHLEVKIAEVADGSRVTLRHRAIGMIDPEHRRGVGTGWNHYLAELKKDCE